MYIKPHLLFLLLYSPMCMNLCFISYLHFVCQLEYIHMALLQRLVSSQISFPVCLCCDWRQFICKGWHMNVCRYFTPAPKLKILLEGFYGREKTFACSITSLQRPYFPHTYGLQLPNAEFLLCLVHMRANNLNVCSVSRHWHGWNKFKWLNLHSILLTLNMLLNAHKSGGFECSSLFKIPGKKTHRVAKVHFLYHLRPKLHKKFETVTIIQSEYSDPTSCDFLWNQNPFYSVEKRNNFLWFQPKCSINILDTADD